MRRLRSCRSTGILPVGQTGVSPGFLPDTVTGKIPVGPTGKMPVLQRAHFDVADIQIQRFARDAQEGIGRIGQRDVQPRGVRFGGR